MTEEEIVAIKEAHEKYLELGPWNLSIILSNEFRIHVSTMSIYRVLYPDKYQTLISDVKDDEIKFYEKHRPYAMFHMDTMKVRLESGKIIYQFSIEDDYSRGYMALCVFNHKHSYFTIITILHACRSYSKPHLLHRDNGRELKNGVVTRLLDMLKIVDVPTKVRNPKGNGKKENGHKQDRKYFYEKYHFNNIDDVEKKIPKYLKFHNEVKGQWARYGQTVGSILEDVESDPLTDEELEKIISELYFKKVERVVKQNGKVKFEDKWYHLSKKMAGKTIEIRITLRGVEIWNDGSFLKRWRYWEYVLGIAADYTLKKYLL